ncbi:MAG: hypothetical protein K9F97_00065 [Candidatus Nanopelagicales bacterium]|nr:hypothetical protein [Candidatus Nanopelagicales bacterium]
MLKAKASLIFFLISWIVVLKYQPITENEYVALTYNALLAVISFYCINFALNSELRANKLLRHVIAAASFAGLIIAFGSLIIGKPAVYEKWVSLGRGTMYLEGKVAVFGDLSHLTSAAKCEYPIIVDTYVCDPWLRFFNQNPIVAEFLKAINLTNVFRIGILSLTLLCIILFAVINKLEVKSIVPYIMLMTPVSVLAIDRGNEVITLIFILIGLFSIHTKSTIRQTMGALSLFFACIFKLWPIVLVFFILIFFWKRVNLFPKCILVLSLFYWIAQIELAINMLDATNSGSPFGRSFGLQLIWHDELTTFYGVAIVVLSLSLLLTYARLSKSSMNQFILSTSGIATLYSLIPVMLTFSLIWALGDSYIYRMIILFPVVLLLGQFKFTEFAFPNFLLSAILVTCIMSLTPLVLVATSALALFFVYLTVTTVLAQRNMKSFLF